MASDAGVSDSQLGNWLRTIAVSVEHGVTACSINLFCAKDGRRRLRLVRFPL
jgi:hypothetical protein